MNLVILDRDGTINEDSDDYIKSPQEWVPVPGSIEAIGRLTRAGYKVVVATNQSGVGRGYFDMDTLNRIHNKMLDAVRDHGGEIDGIFICPHAPDARCKCRKPKPGLFEEIAARLNTNLTGAYALGDTERDIVAARAGGATPIMVRTGKGARTLADPDNVIINGTPVFDNLAAFVDSLLSEKLKV